MVENKMINKKYLREVDRDFEMIPLTFDVMFKGVFEKNSDILKRFLISVLKLGLDVDSTKIEILNNELVKENFREYQKRVDILVVLNGNIYVDIEINRSNFNRVKLRNSMYCDKLYSMLLDMGDKTTRLNDIYLYQLNLNTKDKTISYGEDVIVSFSLVTKDIFIKNKFIVLKYLEFYRNLYYTNRDNLKDDERWLAAMTASSFTELNEMLQGVLDSKYRNRLVGEVIRMSKWEFNLHEWQRDRMDELVKDETERIYREEKEQAIKDGKAEGREEGLAEGREEGLAEGKEEGIILVIKNMLRNNVDLEFISKVTNKSVDEIKVISNSCDG